MYTAQGIRSNDELVTRYAPLVKRIAYHMIGRLPASVMVDDLIQAGMIGLLDAARHYDEHQGASFETYASIRVRGAMLDELRRNDWAPKSVHRKARDVAAAVRRVEAETGNDASGQAVADEMGISLDEYHRILLDASTCKVINFDDLGMDEGAMGDGSDESSPAPLQAVQDERFATSLSGAIDTLPERERLVLSLYYDKELNLKEIGAILGVSESRISQLLSQAHLRLRARLGDWLGK
ncbi:MAG: RNA polymerase sigma factor FliA [Gammaproteobacteria bacterium HGW-Gammaproteobacteria-1]|jgi:RNA polymerase sigma factor for flagellar operon FliA|nr:MAG: RNA polymerase sigma factor FliA [Gammaproteobacteria bacterium HGW-Gammaproteobacteria-1]